MTLKIIVGTLFDITDPTGELLSLYHNGVFMKQVWDGQKWKAYNSGIISFDHTGTKINVVQETGAGKTVLLAIFAYRAHKRGRRIGGNIQFKWTKNNIGKNKKEWKSVLNGMDDISNAENIDLEIDDVYGTITSWNCDAAEFIRTAALTARKSNVNINFTAQFTTNQIPPDLRRITGEYHIPFIRCLDATRKSPDGHNFPLEIIDLRFNGFFQYKGYKVYDLQSETGMEVLCCYDTMEISANLGNDARGREREDRAVKFLRAEFPDETFKHIDRDKGFDIQCKMAAFDVVKIDECLVLETYKKNYPTLKRIMEAFEIPGYLMYEHKDTWRFIELSDRLMRKYKKKDINIRKLGKFKILTIDDIKNLPPERKFIEA